jgi:hypothetical protein
MPDESRGLEKGYAEQIAGWTVVAAGRGRTRAWRFGREWFDLDGKEAGACALSPSDGQSDEPKPGPKVVEEAELLVAEPALDPNVDVEVGKTALLNPKCLRGAGRRAGAPVDGETGSQVTLRVLGDRGAYPERSRAVGSPEDATGRTRAVLGLRAGLPFCGGEATERVSQDASQGSARQEEAVPP